MAGFMQDLPSDIEVLKEIDTSNLDEVFQDYVFASYFLSYMAQKGKDRANRLEQENLELKEKIVQLEKEIEQLKQGQILKYVINSYKVNIDDAQEKLSMHLDEYWREKELDFKRALILQITNTDALSDSQREEIADMIQNYDVNNFKEQADSVFVRKRFLKGNLLGIRINDDEKLDQTGLPDYTTLDFVSNGSHIYGEIMWPTHCVLRRSS